MTQFFRFSTLALALVAGCQNSTPDKAAADSPHETATASSVHGTSPVGVGTVDLNRIGQKLGVFAEIERSKQELAQKFNAFVEEKRANYNKQRKQYPEKLSDEQNRTLKKLEMESNAAIQKVREEADKQLNDAATFYRNEMLDIVRGPVQDIAKKRGLAVVLTEPVFYRTPEADITGDVLESLRATPPDLSKLPSLSGQSHAGQSTGAAGTSSTGGPAAGKETPPKERSAPSATTGRDKKP